MSIDEDLLGLRGILRNAFLWGAAWAAFAFTMFAVLHLGGLSPRAASWARGVAIAVKFGVVGAVAGAAFPVLMRLVYRRQRFAEIGWVRFGLIGGCVTGLFLPLFLQAMNLLSGDGLVPWSLVLDDAAIGLVLGGAAAVGSLWLVRRQRGRPDRC
jgi:hypothetical protein